MLYQAPPELSVRIRSSIVSPVAVLIAVISCVSSAFCLSLLTCGVPAAAVLTMSLVGAVGLQYDVTMLLTQTTHLLLCDGI